VLLVKHPALLVFMGALLAGAVAAGAFAQSPNALRGQRLYETSCLSCHEESVHGRRNRAARSIAEIRSYVSRWSKVANAPWGPEEIDDVAIYLNERYYRFVCPPGTTCQDERAAGVIPRVVSAGHGR